MRRITPGTVIGSIALFVALGGGAYAVSGPPSANSVGTSEIVTNGVGKTEIAKDAVGRAEIRTDSIAGGKLCEENDKGCAPITGANFDESTLQNAGSAGKATQVYRDQAFALPAGAGTERTVLSLDVPAGHYLVSGSATLENTAGGGTERSCFVRAGTDFDRQTEDLGATNGDAGYDLQLVHEFTAPGTITLTCEGGTAAGDISARDRKLQAYVVGDIANTQAATP